MPIFEILVLVTLFFIAIALNQISKMTDILTSIHGIVSKLSDNIEQIDGRLAEKMPTDFEQEKEVLKGMSERFKAKEK